MRTLPCLVFAAALAGCAAPRTPDSVQPAEVTTRADQYAGVVWVDAPDVRESQPPDVVTFRLRGATGPRFPGGYTSLRVEMTSRSWSFLRTALDSSGTILPMSVTDRATTYGGVREIVSVGLSRQYLGERASTGIDLQVRGTRGMVKVKLPPQYVAAFLARYDEVLRDAPK